MNPQNHNESKSMDRRDFLLSTGALVGLFGLSSPLQAEDDNKTKAKKPKQPPLPFVPGSWSIVVLPDIQHYSRSYPELLKMQTEWIVENKKKNNIVYVMQNGDLTHCRTKPEWEAASRGLGVLDGKVPYALVPGNHEYFLRNREKARTTRLNEYFPPSRFKKWPTFGGTMEEGHIDNNYHLFEAGKRKWIIVGLEWAPREATLQWANRLLDKYADRKAIVLVHAYLYQDSTRYDWAKKGKSQKWSPHLDKIAGGVNDGEEIWQKLVKKHPNIFLVVNGHVLGDGLGFQVSKGDQGNRVNEMLVNYQMLKKGGGAWLRLLEFLPDGKTVQARTYSPYYKRFKTDPQNQFLFKID